MLKCGKGSRYLLFGPLFQYSSVQVLTRLKSLSQQIATYRYPQFSWVRKPLSHHIFISVCPFSIARAVYPVGTVGHHEWWISALGSTCIPLRLSICALIWASALTLDIRHGDQVQRPFHITFYDILTEIVVLFGMLILLISILLRQNVGEPALLWSIFINDFYQRS